MTDLLTIGELADETGVAPSALRYYEELGLIPRPRRVSGQRRYESAAIEFVGMILFLRDVGFSLRQTKTLMASRSTSHDVWRELAREKIEELEERITRAQVGRVALQHALRCKHEDILDCPNFVQVLAARREGKPLEDAHTH